MKLITETFKHEEYDAYLEKHIGNVKKAYQILVDNDIVNEDNQIREQISKHDASKYYDDEYNAYGEYFYGSKKDVSHEEDPDFKKAWLFHQHRNPHHWQHWLLKEDEGDQLEALDMPECYIQEMICDWMAFSIDKKNIAELFKWYDSNKDKQILSDTTRKKVEEYLDKIKSKDIELS